MTRDRSKRQFRVLSAPRGAPTNEQARRSRRLYEVLQPGVAGAQFPPVETLCGRLIYNGQPLNDDTTLDGSGYDRVWATTTNPGLGGSVTHGLVITESDVSGGWHYSTGSGGTLRHYLTWKMKPYRLKLGMDLGETTDYFYQPHGIIHLTPFNSTSFARTPVNLRDTGPPIQGHHGRVVVTSPEVITTLAFQRNGSATAHPINGSSAGWDSYVRYVRYVVNGVDVTGPVAVNIAVNGNVSVAGVSWYAFLTASPVTLPSGIDLTDATIEIDLWHEVTVSFANANTSNLDGTGGPDGDDIAFSTWNGGGSAEGWNVCLMHNRTFAIGGSLTSGVGRLLFSGGNANKHLFSNKTIKMVFDRQGPGGVSELRMQTQSGWSGDTTSDGSLKLTHAATSDFVDFVYNQEVPCVVVFKASAITIIGGTSYLGQARYYPVDTGHYDELPLINPLVAVDLREPLRGIWNPKTATVFRLAGRQRVSDDLTTFGQFEPIGEDGTSRDKDSTYYNQFPYEITVQQVNT